VAALEEVMSEQLDGPEWTADETDAYARASMGDPAENDRGPQTCPKCGESCKYDGWGHVHANGVGIGSCVTPPGRSES
jgi:hypothetical protein